jgi:hypothetical protein
MPKPSNVETGTQGRPWTHQDPCTHSCVRARESFAKGRPDPSLCPCRPLTTWLTSLNDRQVPLTIHHGRPQLGPAATDDDHDMAARHATALTLAADHTAPDWWAYVCGRTNHPPAPDQLPTVDDPDDHTGTGWPCACCGQPAEHLDHQLLPWCHLHLEEPT